MFDELLKKIAALRAAGEYFAVAFVVRFEGPISDKPCNKAIIFKDGKIQRWIGAGARSRW
jgi:xanthine/CO dehydrogenase XdhC/CoxF family maturation factor